MVTTSFTVCWFWIGTIGELISSGFALLPWLSWSFDAWITPFFRGVHSEPSHVHKPSLLTFAKSAVFRPSQLWEPSVLGSSGPYSYHKLWLILFLLRFSPLIMFWLNYAQGSSHNTLVNKTNKHMGFLLAVYNATHVTVYMYKGAPFAYKWYLCPKDLLANNLIFRYGRKVILDNFPYTWYTVET